jgi:Fe-S cluster assembly protein SufD
LAEGALPVLELPTQKTKGWEFTDLSGLDLESFPPGRPEVEGLSGNDRPAGVTVAALPSDAERLGTIVVAEDIFTARNEAEWRDGALIEVPAGTVLTDPVRLSVVHPGGNAAVHWRTLIVVGENAEAEVWESYSSQSEDGDGLFNGVVEIVLGPGARLRYVSEQDLSEQTWLFASQRAEVEQAASLEWITLGFGSARGKTRLQTRLAGEGSSAKVTGAYVGGGDQHLDFDTRQEHAAAHTNSDLAFRGVLGGRATSVWSGMIRVDPAAQQTDAFQESRNLLLSKRAHADAIPGLEIEADDVRCTHAAAIAQVDRDQLHYLRSRGLREDDAKQLIVEGFLAALSERVSEGPIREGLIEALEGRVSELLGSAA